MNIDFDGFFEKILGISDPQLAGKLASVAELRRLGKKEILVQEGQPASCIFFIRSGIFRGYFLDVNGRDITDCFGFRYGEPAMAMFDIEAPASVTVESLTDSEVICIPVEEVLKMMAENVFLVQVYNRMLIESLQKHWEIKTVLHKQTAKERYQWFLKAYPGLIDRVTHRYIASFLEMSPVTLSRLRSAENK